MKKGRKWLARTRVRAWMGNLCSQVRSRKTEEESGLLFCFRFKTKDANNTSRFRYML